MQDAGSRTGARQGFFPVQESGFIKGVPSTAQHYQTDREASPLRGQRARLSHFYVNWRSSSLDFDYVKSVVEVKAEFSDGSFNALCPSHPNHATPALHVSPTADGKAVLNCFAGCTYGQLVEALTSLSTSADSSSPLPTIASVVPLNAVSWLSHYCNLSEVFLRSQDIDFDSHKGEIGYLFKGTATVKYRQVGGKKMRWEHNGNEAPPLWPILPEQFPDGIVFLTAGETDCLVLRACQVDAFALTKGEQTKLMPALFTQLKKRGVKEIVYCADVDSSGTKGMLLLQETVERAGLTFNPLDLTDHLDLTQGEKDLRGWNLRVGIAEVRKLLEQDYLQGPAFKSEQVDNSLVGVSTTVPWICMPILAKGGTTLFAALAKSGKTTLLLKILKAMQTGGHVLRYRVSAGKVLLWTENSKMVLKQKIDVHMTPPNPHVFVIYRDEESLLGKPFEEAFHLVIREAKRRDCDLLVLDTLTGLGMVEDENDAALVSKLLVPINRLAHKYQIGVALIHHLGKSGTERGSTVLLSEADIVVRLEGEYKDPRTLKIKNNLLLNQPDELQFKMDDQGVYSLISAADQNADVLDLFSTSQLVTLKDAWEGSGGTWTDRTRASLSRRVKDLCDQGLLHEVVQAGRPNLYQKVMQVIYTP